MIVRALAKEHSLPFTHKHRDDMKVNMDIISVRVERLGLQSWRVENM